MVVFNFFSIQGRDKVYSCIVEVIGLSGSTGNAMHVEVIYRHVHVEAGKDYEIYAAGVKCKLKDRINPEDYMKTKFDENGNAVK